MELPAGERTAYIRGEAADDQDMQAQVDSLLRAHLAASEFIEDPALVESPVLAELIPRDTQPLTDLGDAATERRIGAYRLVREIGSGGMGTVYLAERADGEFRQQVAIKLIKRGMDTDFVLRRFRNERQILASLNHPNIARLIGGGTTDDGLPYFVMEYVAGVPLHDYCDRERLTIKERLRLFCKICGAITHAHRNGVVHRDIKPGNILVTPEGIPMLLDFGIAKLLNPDLAAQTLDPTLTALRLMTPEYASPEQVCGGEITLGTDVYSLGVVLYEMLTGHRPHIFKNRSPHELSRVICDVEPELPSRAVRRSEARTLLPGQGGGETTLARICRVRQAEVEELRRELTGNLDRIVMRALQKGVGERYSEVEGLCADITRHLDGQPVSAAVRVTTEVSLNQKGRRRAGDAGDAHALAVLPFKLLNPAASPDTGDGYLGVGLADALITRLGSLRRFVVRPTSSVLRFQDGDAGDSLAAGRELGVSFVLDGRIQRAGGMLRVTAQLLEVESGVTRWAQVFDEKSTDVLALQDKLTERVAEALLPHLSRDERERLAKRGTDDPEAFEAYLRGRYHWSTFTEEGFAKAITCYYRAIAIDPDFALAYTGVADYHNWLGVYNVLPSGECFAAAKEAARRAISLNPNLAEAHSALGFALVGGDYDWAEAEHHHSRALELDPNCITAHVWYSLQLAMEGRFEESLARARRSVELDPLAPFNRYNLGWILYQARRYDESAEVQRTLLADEPNYGIAHFGYGWSLTSTGRFTDALDALRRARELMPGISFVIAGLAIANIGTGDAEAARQLLQEMSEAATKRFVTPYHFALVHAALGDVEETFASLEKAYELRDSWLAWLGVEPLFDTLRDDARYADLLRRTKNPSSARLANIAGARRADLPSNSQVTRIVNAARLASAPVPAPTDNLEAHQLYVAGRYYATRRTAEGMYQAISRLERAVELDPKFAVAYAELADCYALLNWYVEPPPQDAFEKARQAAQRAIEADDKLADAHASLGLIKFHYERDWAGAESEFQRAIELKPDNPVAHRWYAFNLSAAGRHDEAIAEIRRAQKISPRSPVIATAVANVLFLARRYDEAIAQCHSALELDAGSVAAYVVQRWAYEKKGMCDEALAAFEQERIFAGETPTTHAKHAHVLAACGRHAEAREVLNELLAKREEQWITSYEIAVIYSLLDDKDNALRWLAQAEQEHVVGFTFVVVDPHLDNLRTDSRFDDLLRATNMLERAATVIHTTASQDSARSNPHISQSTSGRAEVTRIGVRHTPAHTGEQPLPTTGGVLSSPRTGDASIHASTPSAAEQNFIHRTNSPQTNSHITNPHETNSQVFATPARRTGIWAASILLFVLVATSGVFLYTRSEQGATKQFRTGQVGKLTTTGNAVGVAISPDGKYVAYAVEEAGRQSLWVRQTGVANSVRVVGPSEISFRGLTFLPDGTFIYYVTTNRDAPDKGVLYKVPAFGGSSQRVKDAVDSPVALSSDGKQFAFVRRDAERGKDVLIVADTSGNKEQEIATRTFPEHISIGYAPVWSAHDERLAFAVEGSDSHGSFMKAVSVSLADKREFPLSSRRWLNIGQMAWLPGGGLGGGSSLLMTAQEEGSSFTQLWQFDSAQSEAHKLTDDLADYLGVNVSADGASLVTVRREMLTSVWAAPENATERLTQITTGAGRFFDLSWTPDDKIIYASDARGSADIWEMNPDSTGQRQLTAGAGRNYAPVASPDNKHIVFHSDRSGEWQIWRMTREGNDPVQLTPAGEDSNWAQITPDGVSVIYERTSASAPVTLWQVPLAGGDPVRLTEGLAMRPSISPDGKSLAYWHKEGKPGALWHIAIKPLDATGEIKLLDAPQGIANGITILRWTRDGKAVMYLDYRNTTTTVWQQPLDASSTPVKMFESTGNVLIHSFAASPGGQLVMSRGLMINDAVIIANAAAERFE